MINERGDNSLPVQDSLPNRASDSIEKELRRMIVSLELPPGASLTEAYLAKRLKCGRTPLREALQRLSQEYLVVSQPGRGISIAGMDVVDLVELIEATALVGGTLASIATERITDDQISELEQVVDQAEAADSQGDFLTVGELDFRFHHIIAEATRNRYLTDAVVRLQRLTMRFGWVVWRRRGTAGPSLMEHRQIIAALKNRNAVDAGRLISEHWHAAWNRMAPVLRGPVESNSDKNIGS